MLFTYLNLKAHLQNQVLSYAKLTWGKQRKWEKILVNYAKASQEVKSVWHDPVKGRECNCVYFDFSEHKEHLTLFYRNGCGLQIMQLIISEWILNISRTKVTECSQDKTKSVLDVKTKMSRRLVCSPGSTLYIPTSALTEDKSPW